MDLRSRLEARGFLNQFTSEELFEQFNAGNKVLYVGFDPTADSLHLGNFVQFMHALQYMLYGNKAILVVGGATGMIGDPGGKDAERSFLDEETLAHNVASITKQVGEIIQGIEQSTGTTLDYEVVNNIEFYKDISYIDFLREVGKHITVNQMMHKETVKNRLTQDGKFISYTEFSYMLMQAYDYLQLFETKHCTLQISGSDQRGNIVTGVELIRKKNGKEAFGSTCPLITDSTGKKFGKSEGNAIWLDPTKNSPYVCFNYFMNSADEDLEKYLLLFTLLDPETIKEIVVQHNEAPHLRNGQERLAQEIAGLIYGKASAKTCSTIKSILFGANETTEMVAALNSEEVSMLNAATSNTTLAGPDVHILDLLVDTGLFESKGAAKKGIKSNAVSLNDHKITDSNYTLTDNDFVNNLVILKKGKKHIATARLLTT